MLHKWKYPKLKDKPDDLSKVTDEILTEWETEYKKCNKANEELKADLLRSKEHIITSASLLFGQTSNVVNYLKKQRINSPSRFNFNDLKLKVSKAKDAEASRAKEMKLEVSKEELTVKAIKWLTERGYSFGEDFNISNAITFANEITFNSEVETQVRGLAEFNTFTRFQGDDFCENCKGWDGVSTRCQCGAHRVEWKSNDTDDFFLNPNIYGCVIR